ncbi:MAG: sigma 54-interacting transcriptional regulator, partial [Clostridia bacterium]|nr:sigma 54-interacting transcriptional regulator [Clostridia bacterium]
LRNACVRYAGMNSPVLIVGAHGTGKDQFAHYIYSLGKLKHSSMIVIDMCMQNGKSLLYLMQSLMMSLLGRSRIFLNNREKLSANGIPSVIEGDLNN